MFVQLVYAWHICAYSTPYTPFVRASGPTVNCSCFTISASIADYTQETTAALGPNCRAARRLLLWSCLQRGRGSSTSRLPRDDSFAQGSVKNGEGSVRVR